MIWEARPKGGLTSRHKKELHKAGFGWCGYAWLCQSATKPKVWGCNVRPHKEPAGDKIMSGVLKILAGKSEFGK